MKQKRKPLTKAKYLQALALFTCAREAQRRVDDFSDELGRILGYPVESDNYLGNISDAIYNATPLDVALAKEGFTKPKV